MIPSTARPTLYNYFWSVVCCLLNSCKRTKIKNDKLQGWWLELACFNYSIRYRPSKNNVASDTLSRAFSFFMELQRYSWKAVSPKCSQNGSFHSNKEVVIFYRWYLKNLLNLPDMYWSQTNSENSYQIYPINEKNKCQLINTYLYLYMKIQEAF